MIETKKIAERFIIVSQQIIDGGMVENKTEFCKSINLQVSNYNKILAGERLICLSRLVDLMNRYHISSRWLIEGVGSVWQE